MIYKQSSVIVKNEISLPDDTQKILNKLLNVLDLVDALYSMQRSGSLNKILENILLKIAFDKLKDVENDMPGQYRENFKHEIARLESGIYDLISLPVTIGPGNGLEIIFGKVFSSDNDLNECYAGAIGLSNEKYGGLISKYDSYLKNFQSLAMSKQKIQNDFTLPVFRCIDVLRYSGDFNRLHKPICVFYSGGNRENVSALSNLVVFPNYYLLRFINISLAISHRLLMCPFKWEDIDTSTIEKLLIIWLRGHDIGHFLGVDNLARSMDEFDQNYMILHELKADSLSLYNLRFIRDDILDDEELILAYYVSIAEMFRYIKRGDFSRYPDSGSAYITYRFLKDNGSLVYDSKSKKYHLNIELFQNNIEQLAGECVDIFSSGDIGNAKRFLEDHLPPNIIRSGPASGELSILNDVTIPSYLNIEYSIVDNKLSP